MEGMIQCGYLPNGNIGMDLLKGKSCLPLIIGQGPAGPVFDAAVNRIVWFDPFSADAGLLQNIIGKLNSGLTNDQCEVTTAKSVCDTGSQEETVELTNNKYRLGRVTITVTIEQDKTITLTRSDKAPLIYTYEE